MDLIESILQNLANPAALEAIYRNDPEGFTHALDKASIRQPDSMVLAVWHERIHYIEPADNTAGKVDREELLILGGLAILAGLCARFIFAGIVNETSKLPVNLLFGIVPFMIGWLVFLKKPTLKINLLLVTLLVLCIAFVNLLPNKGTDAFGLTQLHMPILLWLMIGLAYTGNNFKLPTSRLAFLKFNGEFIILYAIMAIGGIVLTLLSNWLFLHIYPTFSEFYAANIIPTGIGALAIVATYLVSKKLNIAKNIAPYMAKIFSPLVLVTLIAYLISAIVAGTNPFTNRDFLLIFNGVLFGVLLVIIFSFTERNEHDQRNIFDWFNYALILLALLTDVVALSAIVFRLSAYGLTPNRLAVLGFNLVILFHLGWIFFGFTQFMKNRSTPIAIQNIVVHYLPVYGVWATIVVFVFPLIFT